MGTGGLTVITYSRSRSLTNALSLAVAFLLFPLLGCSSADGTGANAQVPLRLTAEEIVTAPARIGTTHVLVQDPDTSASYSFALRQGPGHGAAGVDVNGAVWYLPDSGFTGRDQLTVMVSASRADLEPTAITVAATVDPAGLNSGQMRVYSSPYAAVDWGAALRLKVQLHDHVGTTQARLLAYDAAGYDVISTMNYSGMRAFSYALGEVRWPVENWLPPAFLGGLTHLKFFIPNAEQVGYIHATSPFLATYIERWDDSVTPTPARQPWHYASEQEELSLIGEFGGFPIVAHPWYGAGALDQLTDFSGIEVYSAFARAKAEEGTDPYYTQVDRNEALLATWDHLLLGNQRILGVAVNDHFGPDNTSVTLSSRTRDSGKILALVPAGTAADLRQAMEAGAVLAVKDVGQVKNAYPQVDSISLGLSTVTVETGGTVSWIANGHPLLDGKTLDFARLPAGTTFVRAEVRNAEGSTVFTQAFPVRQIGDMDGDGDIDAVDAAICPAVRAGIDPDPDHRAACVFVQAGGMNVVLRRPRGSGGAPAGLARPRREKPLPPRWRRGNARARYDFPGCAEYPG